MTKEAIIIGVSAGGFKALEKIITNLEPTVSIPIIIVQHIGVNGDNYIVSYLNEKTHLKVKEVDEKEEILKKNIYFAPPNYHVLIERNKTLSLSVEEKVCYARPAIDVSFETAAEAYTDKLVGIVLTGANSDGSQGSRSIKVNGGEVIVQDPNEAEFDEMPLAAIRLETYDSILTLDGIIKYINNIK